VRKYKLFWILLVIGVFVFNICLGLFLYSSNNEAFKPLTQKITTVRPTPFPFQELTVPYLRNREYKSNLGELNHSTESEEYIGYLTSYDSDGLNINAYLTIPTGTPPPGGWPAVIFIHGYIPPANYRTLENYSQYVDGIARSGIAVFKIDLRGHGSSQGEPSGAYYSGDYIVDVLNAYSALSNSDRVNVGNIGLWGHSMAGNVVMRSLAAKPDIPAAVIWAGAVYSYSDWQKYGIEDGSFQPAPTGSERQRRRQQLFDTHGQFDPESPFWKTVAPTNYLSDIKTAIQLNHAVDDLVVDIGYSRDLSAMLQKSKIKSELNEIQGGGHNISGDYFNQAMAETVRFFNENL
jgi:uncharacterized protein